VSASRPSLIPLAAWFGFWAVAAAIAARLMGGSYPLLVPVCLLLAMGNAAAAAGLAGYRKWGRWTATAFAALGLGVPVVGTGVNAAILWLLWRKDVTAALEAAEALRRARLPWLREHRVETRLCLVAIGVLAIVDLVLWARYTASAGGPRAGRALPAVAVRRSPEPTRVPPTRPLQPTRALPTLPPEPTRASTAAATEAPHDKPASAPDGSVLLSDDFSGSACLATLSDGKGEMACEDGEFSQSTAPAGLIHKALYDLVLSDYALEVDARVVDGPDECCCGLVFGWQLPDEFYYFWISTDGRYTLQRHSGSGWATTLSLRASPYIRRGTATNRLRVSVDMGQVTLAVNGHELASVALPAEATTGRVGLASGTCFLKEGVHVHFDNVYVYAMAPATPTPAMKVPARLSSGAHAVDSPSGLTWDGANLWCTTFGTPEDGDRLYRLDSVGRVIASIPSPATGAEGLAWDGSALWLSDSLQGRIYRLDAAGAVLASFAYPGDWPRDLTWDGTSLWVADSKAGLIYRLDTSGQVLDSLPAPGSAPVGLAWDGAHLWLSDPEADMIYELDTGGLVLANFAGPGPVPRGLAWDGSSLCLVDEQMGIVFWMRPEE
jgi:hypothetical protein